VNGELFANYLERIINWATLHLRQYLAGWLNQFLIPISLRYQRGIGAGILNIPAKIRKTMNAQEIYDVLRAHLERTAGLPQSAFNEVAHNLQLIQQAGLSFDPSKSNNLLIDAEQGKINIVDVGLTSTNRPPTLSDMATSLIDNYGATTLALKDAHHLRDHPDLIAFRRQILKKCLEAARVTGLHIPDQDASLEYSFKLAGWKGD